MLGMYENMRLKCARFCAKRNANGAECPVYYVSVVDCRLLCRLFSSTADSLSNGLHDAALSDAEPVCEEEHAGDLRRSQFHRRERSF